MPTLSKIQTQFATDVLTSKAGGDYLPQQKFAGTDLIKIYRNNYILNLTATLKSTYSCVLRLVGEDFFTSLARNFIAKTQPKTGNIRDYGTEFADFINTRPECKNLPFLADVAKFEQAYENCYFAKNAKFLLSSKYPLIKIWQLDESSADLDLASGGDNILIYKDNFEVVVERISPEIFQQMEQNDADIIKI